MATLFDDEERTRMIGLGESGGEFARKLNSGCLIVPIETTRFERERERRILKVGKIPLPELPIGIDDVAVSGSTLRSVSLQLGVLSSVGVGMLYKSKTTRRRIGVTDIRSALTYTRVGGGNPPINSAITLQTVPTRLSDLAERYFTANQDEFKNLIGQINA